MFVLRVINNSTISSMTENGDELVLMGKGIGFNARKGDPIELTKIEKKYRLLEEHASLQEKTSLQDMNTESEDKRYDRTVEEIIELASRILDYQLTSVLGLNLKSYMVHITDCKQKGRLRNYSLVKAVKRYYPKEYQVGYEAVEIIKKYLGYELPEEEAGYIAMHLINAEI